MVSTPHYRGNTATMTETVDRTQRPSSFEHDGAEPASWHPKLTPYRLMIIITTIAFGTAKAILTQRQSVEAPITLEWLFGTLLSLVFFMVSSYDSRENGPPYLHWLFKPDCMDPVWTLLLAWFSIQRPIYISIERSTPESLYWDRPLITPYRILVCTTVALVGMSKAMLGYYGLSTDVTWIDWSLAVPLTMILYCLGLYEYNSSGVLHTFFASDQIHVFYSLSNVIVGTLQLSACVAWTAFWGFYFRDVTYSPKWDMKTQRPADFKPTITTFFEDMADRGLKLVIQEFIIAAIVGGLVVCFIVVRQLLVKSGMMRILSSARRRITHDIAHLFSFVAHRGMWIDSQSLDLSTRQPRHFSVLAHARPIFRIVFHIAIHVVGLVIVGSYAMLAAGFTITLHGAVRPVARDIICLTAPYIIPTFLGMAACGLVVAEGRILFSMLFPFWRWLVRSIPVDNTLMAPRI